MKIKEALEYYADDENYEPTMTLNGMRPPAALKMKGKLAKEALTELYTARLESWGHKEALAYFMEAETLKENFGDGIAIDSLRAQGYAKGEAALCSSNA